MSTDSESTDLNKSAYVALSCLMAFVIVITICILKQFIWDPLLAKPFESIRPVLSKSVQRFSSSFYRQRSTRTSSMSVQRSLSEVCLTLNDPPLLSSQNLITVTQSLPLNNSQYSPISKKISPRSYGSSSINSFAYTNLGSDNLADEQIFTPILHFSCEYNPSRYTITLNIQNLQHMSIFNDAIKSNAYVLIRFILPTIIPSKLYETSSKAYQDYIRFGQSFIILNNIHPGDILNYQIKFFIIIIVDGNNYEIAEGIHSLKDDCLTYISFIEKTLPMNLKLINNETK
jgi:hypothetical protein